MLTRGFTGAVLVLLGGLVISTLPPSTPLMQVSWLLDLRGAATGRMAALAVVVLGLGLLTAAWLRLCRAVARAPDGERESALLLVRTALVCWSAPLLLAPPLFSRDGWSYAAQGMLAHLGLSPYEHGPGVLVGPVAEAVDPRWLDTPAPYGPVPLVLGDLGAGLTGNPWVLVVGHRLIALGGLVMLAWALPRMARWCGTDPALVSAVALASPLVLAHGVGGLHNDLLMVGLMAVALVLAVEHGAWAGALAGGLAAGVKLPGGLVCIGVALVALPVGASLRDRLRGLAQVAAGALAALVLPGLAWGLGVGWVAALGAPATVQTPLSLPTVLGGWLDLLAGVLGLGLPDAALLDLVRTLAQAAILAVAVWVALRAPTGDQEAAVRAVALVLGATILLSPVVHLWYFLWVTPFVAVLRLSRLAMTALLAASAVSGLVAPLDSSLHGAYLAIVIGSMTVAATVLVLLVTRGARERLEKIATAAWPEPQRAGAIRPVTSPSASLPPPVDGAV